MRLLRLAFRLVPLALTAVFNLGCSSSPARGINAKAPPGTGLSVCKFKTPDGKTHKCSVFIPYAYDARKSWPTIVFLHGLGEGGSDGVRNTTVGLGPAIRRQPERFHFIAVFPQSGGRWSTEKAEQRAIASLDAVESRFNVDRRRVYLTGLSTGGYGTWAIGAKHRSRFAALVPLCAYSGEAFAAQLVGMPIWAFHNAFDPFVRATATKSTVRAINRLGGKARQTIYSAVGHNCWDEAYASEALYAWLLAQQKS